MKTPLQELIEQWNKELQNPLSVLEDHRAYHTEDIWTANREIEEIKKRIDQATELLEKEREVYKTVEERALEIQITDNDELLIDLLWKVKEGKKHPNRAYKELRQAYIKGATDNQKQIR